MRVTEEVPIGDYGLIGDTRTAALVAPSGSIDWCCVPRFDSPPIFGRLVSGADGGHFGLRPADPAHLVARGYRESTTTLDTRWSVDGGELLLSDSMIGEVTGRLLPDTVIVRRLVASGRPMEVAARIAPRFGYGRGMPTRCRRHGKALLIEHHDLVLTIETNANCQLLFDQDVVFTVDPVQPVTFVMTTTDRAPAIFVPPPVAATEAERDERGWKRWAEDIGDLHQRDAAVRSLLTLQLLTYSPSGAPVAAPTTSLPEQVGGGRNWDYRYAWPRDASIGIGAFLGAGKPGEAQSFMAWMRHASRLARPRLPVLFTVHGRPGPRELELASWPGYRGSRPVRVGNGAAGQHQLDGYGWVLDAAWLLTEHGKRLDGETWRVMCGYADRVARTWMLPDAGVWERRDNPRHHVHSKLMAWLALDRAARIAEHRGGRAAARVDGWRAVRDAIGTDIRGRGFDADLGTYTAAYGTQDLDAAVLVLPLVGIEPPNSPRVSGTINAIRSSLGAGGPLVYRYLDDDGLPGGEGAFLPCSFWMAQALAGTGQIDEASEMFEQLVGLAGAVGLYAEEMDPVTHEHLGNFPQALTHAALLQAALAIDAATHPANRT